MASLDQLELPNGANYEFKDNTQTNSNHRHQDSDLVPITHKKYESTSYYASDNNHAGATWYFMSVKPDSWYLPWRVKFKVHSYCPSYASYESYTYSTITGRQDGIAYANWNERGNSAHSYINIYPLKQAGYNANYGHAIGVGIYNADNRTNSAYYRTFEIDYYDCENCTVTILDTPVKWADWTGAGETNYTSITAGNAIDRGLRETGDENSWLYALRNYSSIDAGPNQVYPYTFIMQNSDGRWESIVTSSSTSRTKSCNSHGFRLGQLLIAYTNNTYAENAHIGGVYEFYSNLVDHRYSFNTTNSATYGTTAYRPVYLVGSLGNDGLFYLDTTKWWTQTLPSTEDGKLYIYLGDAYDYYRMIFSTQHPIYRYSNGKVREYAQNAGTVNGHTVAVDVPSNNVTGSGTSGSLAKWSGTNTITDGPALGSSTSTFLRNDGTWAVPSGAGDVTGPSSSTANNIATYSDITGKVIKDSGKTFSSGSTDTNSNHIVMCNDSRLSDARPASNTTSTYSTTGTDPVNGTAVASAFTTETAYAARGIEDTLHIRAGGEGLKQHSLCARLDSGNFSSFTTNSGTGSKTFSTTYQFDVYDIFCYDGDTDVSGGTNVTSTTIKHSGIVDMRYTLNGVTTDSTSVLEPNKPLYLKFNYNDFNSAWNYKIVGYTQDPNDNVQPVTGVQVLVGYMINYHECNLLDYNPVYVDIRGSSTNTQIMPLVDYLLDKRMTIDSESSLTSLTVGKANTQIGAGHIETIGHVDAGSWLQAGTSITAGSYVDAGSWIQAGTSITAGSYVSATGYVEGSNIWANDGSFYCNSSTIDLTKNNNGVSADTFMGTYLKDKNNDNIAKLGWGIRNSGDTYAEMYVYNKNDVQNRLALNVTKSGTLSVQVSSAAAWREALNIIKPQVIKSDSIAAVSVGNNSAKTLTSFTLQPGKYIVMCWAKFAAHADTGYRYIFLTDSSTGTGPVELMAEKQIGANNTNISLSMDLNLELTVSSATTYYFRAWHTAGASISVTPRYHIIQID